MIKDRLKKGVHVLPTLLTMGNILCGMFAIVASFNRDWFQAGIAICIAFALDGLDGRIARIVDSESEFGLELDALADLVSFGVAPAMIAYTNWLFVYERLGILLAFMFVCGAALRLARFNAHDVEGGTNAYFNGFPTPAAAGVIVSYYFIEYKFFVLTDSLPDRLHQAFILIVPMTILALSYLMLSNLRYPNFKKAARFDGNKFGVITALLLFIVVAARFPLMVFSIAFLGYFFLGFINFSWLLSFAGADKNATQEP